MLRGRWSNKKRWDIPKLNKSGGSSKVGVGHTGKRRAGSSPETGSLPRYVGSSAGYDTNNIRCAEKYRNDSILVLSRGREGIVHRYHKGAMGSQKGNYGIGQGGPANAEYKRTQLGEEEESQKKSRDTGLFKTYTHSRR